jgi:hypothetical protein
VAKKYRVVFLGVNVALDVFSEHMAKLGVSGPVLENYIKKAPVVLRRDLSLADARRYAEAIINAGGLVHIQETGEFPDIRPSYRKMSASPHEDFMVCHTCGFKQKRGDRCVRCGFELSSSP